jgi:pimeloyl-ACP methyl ester carboxylesterase
MFQGRQNACVAKSDLLTLSKDGITLVGERWPGTGPVVVFLHAGITDRRSWNEVAQRLTQSVTPVTYDRRGFGGTPVSQAPFSHVDDLLAVLKAVADGPAWLVGSSMGGGLALDAALIAPELIAGLVLIAPAVSGDTRFEMDPDTSRFEPLLDEAAEKHDLEEVNRLETWLWLDGPGQPEGRVGGPVRSLVMEMNEMIIRNGVEEGTGASGLDSWDRIGEVRAPTTVACGDLDVPFFVKRSREIAKRLPSGRFIEMKGVAHLPQMETPALVADLVIEACLGTR